MTPPSSIAHYQIIGKLGEGGMGVVWRATDTKLNRQVAIKLLPETIAVDTDRFGRFTREAQVLASLNHPNIAAIYGVEDRALVMELVEGTSPAGPMSADDAKPLIEQLIDALEYAHEKGVIHRDLKPANLKVTPEGVLKLLDFGLAKAVETTRATTPSVVDSPTLTIAASLPGVIMGTAGYMSPEQARGGKVDHRTDIWAFGAVLFELLTGRRAFPGDTVSDTLASVLKSDPDFTQVPERFRPLVERCLSRDLKRRLGWIGDARLLLETPAPAPVKRTLRRGILPLAVCLALAAGFAASRFWPARIAPSRIAASKITRVTTDSSSVAPAISADGKLVAYLARREGRSTLDLWVQQVGGGSAIRITDDPGILFWSHPMFSADASRVFYYSTREPAGIYEVPVLGGEPRIVVASASTDRILPSPDGKWLAYPQDGKLLLRPAEGGDPRILLAKPAIPAAWSPDSSRIMAEVNTGDQFSSGPIIVPIDGSPIASVGDLRGNLLHRGFADLNFAQIIAWVPGDEVFFNARYGDAVNLWRIPIKQMGDAMPSAVTLGPWRNWLGSVSGNYHMAFTSSRITNQVWRLAVDMETGKVGGIPERITDDLVEAQFPNVLPDDSLLTFVSRRGGAQGVYLMDLKTRRERRLHQDPFNNAYSILSADGTQVAFGGGNAGWPAFLVSTAGGDAKPVGKAEGRLRDWTRDGRSILVWRVLQGQPTTVALFDLSTKSLVEIVRSPKYIVAPRLSPDNRWLAFQTDNGTRAIIWLAPFHGASPISESEWIRIGSGVNPFWSPDSGTLYFFRFPEGVAEASLLMRQPLDPKTGNSTSAATQLYRLDGGQDAPVINTATASRSHLYFLLKSGMSEIWIMDLPH